jgi:large subunit ribosomal protein L9
MEIILKEDIAGLGYKNDIVKVKDGYGRNYLIPQGKAVIATESAKKVLAENERQRAHKLAKIKADAEEAAKKYEGVSLVIAAKVSDKKNIYGSVGAAQIAEALNAKGIETDVKKVVLKAVKELGHFTAVVQLHKEVAVEIPFEVIAENAPVEEKEEEAPKAEETPAEEPAEEPETEEEAEVAE